MIQERKEVFSLEQLVLAPPVAERASAFRHRQILRSFDQGIAGVLRLTPLLPSEARRHFGAELLRARPAPQVIKRFLQHSQKETALFALLRFLPRDIVEAEIWAYSENSPQGVRVAQTSLHHREALGNQQLVGNWEVFADVESNPNSFLPQALTDQAHTHIHPNLRNGGTVTGLSREEAQRHFDALGDSLAQTLQNRSQTPTTTLPRSQALPASTSGIYRTDLKLRVQPGDFPRASRPSSALRPPR